MKWSMLIWWWLSTVAVGATQIIIDMPETILQAHLQIAKAWGRCQDESDDVCLRKLLTKAAEFGLSAITLGHETTLTDVQATLDIHVQ